VWRLSRSGNSSGKTLDEMIKLERGNKGGGIRELQRIALDRNRHMSCSYETANAQLNFTKGAKHGHNATNCLSIRRGLSGLITDTHIDNPGTAAPPPLGHRPLHCSCFQTHAHTHTVSKTDRTLHRPLYTQHTTNTRDEDEETPAEGFKPHSQQTISYRPAL